MSYLVQAFSGGINLSPKTRTEEILQNIGIVLATQKGSVPLCRDLGLSGEIIDQPINISKPLLVSEIISAISEFEPRAEVVEVSFKTDADKLIPIVEVKIIE
ncbi:MAG: hypothetical protein RR394_02670 [Oscillospiraceae bacterium]